MRRVHYVLSTHWDREWYQTFQDYRHRMVQLIDRLLAGWEREDLCGPFQTDGQAIMLEDYLEVRPERRAQVQALVTEGRFKVGPWYVLPDEFLVSGESLVRNLALGRAIARQLGGVPSNAGFLCDMFGHNSQMPQILAGFGVTGALVWRGMNMIERRPFIWRGADGTELPSYRFGRVGYCSFGAQVRQMDLSGPRMPAEDMDMRLDIYLDEEAEKTPVGPILVFDGCDHCEWDPEAYRLVARRLGHTEDPAGKYEWQHSTLDAYLDELVAVKDQIGLVVEGELREPARHPGGEDAQWLIPGVTSSRVPLKQANAHCQTLLCSWAEPVSALAAAAIDQPYPHGYLDVAWRWLIQNHPHDSICGCSIDAVHQDMIYRFHQAEGIANRLTLDATHKLAACVQGELGDDDLRLVLFNPLPQAVDEVTVIDVEVPVEWPGAGSEMGGFDLRPGLRLFDAHNQPLDYQRLAQTLNQPRFRLFDTTFPRGYKVNVVRVAVRVRIAALGYTTLTARPGEPGMPTSPPAAASIVSGHRSLANEFLTVTVDSNGTLTVLDRRCGNVYRSLLTFEDTADAGDGWNYAPAINDIASLSSACHADVALVHNGPLLGTFRVRVKMELPAEFDFASMTRGTRVEPLVIESLVSLKAGAERVEVETTVHNTVQDHRLRVLFPSQAGHALTYLADSPFDVVERPIALRADNHLYREPEIEAKPQQSWTAVYDDQRGLAVVSPGQLETAIIDTPERTLALTLFRATRHTVFTAGEPGGQLLGDLRFHYAIVPLIGAPDRTALFNTAGLLAAGIRAAQVRPVDVRNITDSLSRDLRAPLPLPLESGFVALEGPVVLTSLRQTAAGLEVRLFNPNVAPVQATLNLAGWPAASQRPTRAAWVNLESSPLGESFDLTYDTFPFEVRGKEIKTLCLI